MDRAISSPARGAGRHEEAAHVGGLARVLDAVVDDADQANAQRDGRVPGAVDDAVEIVGAESPDVVRRSLRHGVEVAEQRVGVAWAHGRHVRRRVPVPRVVRVGVEADVCGPVARDPELVGRDQLGHVRVLHAGQVPHEPCDRVGVGGGPCDQLVGVEPSHRPAGEVGDAGERFGEESGDVHRASPPRGAAQVRRVTRDTVGGGRLSPGGSAEQRDWGAMSGMREMWAALRGSVVVAVRRVHPVVLFGVGLLTVTGLFAALALVGATDGLDDLGLGSSDDGSSSLSAPADEGDASATAEGNGLTDGLASRGDGGSSTTTGGAEATSVAPGTTSPAEPSGAPRTGRGLGLARHGGRVAGVDDDLRRPLPRPRRPRRPRPRRPTRPAPPCRRRRSRGRWAGWWAGCSTCSGWAEPRPPAGSVSRPVRPRRARALRARRRPRCARRRRSRSPRAP